MCIAMYNGKIHASQDFVIIKVGNYEAVYERSTMGAAGRHPEMLEEFDTGTLRRWFDEHQPVYGEALSDLHKGLLRKLKQTCCANVEVDVVYTRDGKVEEALRFYEHQMNALKEIMADKEELKRMTDQLNESLGRW